MKKSKSLLLLTALLCAALLQSGCSGRAGENTASPSSGQTAAPSGETGAENTKDTAAEIDGYELTSRQENGLLQSEVFTYAHPQSGATVVCIRNDDPELAFGIYYHTPMVDETDTNHVFEHAIIAGSEKYPSSDLFFDLVNKSYNTFINAFTYDTFTGYPLSTKSQEQLMTMMDAYLSCMAAPDILTNENIFKREALRFELADPESPIEMTGTVYSEDFGSLTDINQESLNNVADALYPGETASNSIGRAHRNYENLTYEHTIETYDRCYSFDNSLILLYGDMDYERVMGFINEEYLSKAQDRGTDLSAYLSAETEPGYVETVVECPAFEGDVSENASYIDYAISLDGMGWEELLYWSILSNALNQENSAYTQTLRAAGISNQSTVELNLFNQKPYLLFRLYLAEKEQAGAFKAAVNEALLQISEEGLDENLWSSVLKREEIANYQIRDMANAGVNLFPNIVNYWTHTGETDYYGLCESTFSDLLADSSQEIIKGLAAAALSPERSALVSTVPTPGLAEELIARKDQYLADMKAAMSDEEIAALVAETEEFNAWNSESQTNSSFVIDPSQVEDLELYDGYERTQEDGLTFYTAPAEVNQIGRFALYLDASGLTNEDILYFSLYRLLLGELPAGEYEAEELMTLTTEYLPDLSITPMYPEGPKAEDPHPMVKVMWTGLTADQDTSLSLLTDLLLETDVDSPDDILELINRYKDSYDLSRNADFLSLANESAQNGSSMDMSYKKLFKNQDFYYFLEDASEKLSADESYIQELSAGIKTAREKLLTRQRLIYVIAAPEAELAGLKESAKEILLTLPQGQPQDMQAQMDGSTKSQGIIVESSDQYVVNYGNFYKNEEMDGCYLPFLTALSDRYLIPVIRFQNGAYSAGISFNIFSGGALAYSYSDPNAGTTIDVFAGMGDAVREMELTEEDLNGYILNTLSYSGIESGVLSMPMQAVEFEIMGRDTERALDTFHDIKNAALTDQETAADVISDLFTEGNVCAVGNEAKLRADESRFDELISYRSGN